MKKWISFLIAIAIIIVAFLIIKPRMADSYYQKARTYMDSSKYELAASYYTKALKFNKKHE